MRLIRFRNILFFSLLVIFLHSCGFFSSDNPCDHTIEKQKMIELMGEVILLETYLSSNQTQAGVRDSVEIYYAGLFQKYEVTALEYQEALECYMLDEKMMTQMLDEVLSDLSILNSKADEKKDDEKKVDYSFTPD